MEDGEIRWKYRLHSHGHKVDIHPIWAKIQCECGANVIIGSDQSSVDHQPYWTRESVGRHFEGTRGRNAGEGVIGRIVKNER